MKKLSTICQRITTVLGYSLHAHPNMWAIQDFKFECWTIMRWVCLFIYLFIFFFFLFFYLFIYTRLKTSGLNILKVIIKKY